MSVWTEERVETLITLWAQGYSASAIADKLACGFTRSAVIGKVHRLRLPGRMTTHTSDGAQRDCLSKSNDKRRPSRAKVKAFRGRGKHLFEVAEYNAPLPPPPDPDYVPPVEQRKQLLELTNTSCRWPYGDVGNPDFYFCGGPDADFSVGRPYCSIHRALGGAGYTLGRRRKPDLARHTRRRNYKAGLKAQLVKDAVA